MATMTLADWLDDLTVRFLLNLPPSELSSVPRLCFQVEEAQWFYEDFIRPLAASVSTSATATANNPTLLLPSLPLRQFCLHLFRHCPLLSGFTDAQHMAAYEEFLAYRVRVPVRGAILVDEAMEKVVLVKGWKKNASWSFPRGKINKDEKDLDCAIREVYEETGFDLRAAALIPEDDGEGVQYIDVTLREQHVRLFLFRGVDENTVFEPQTRKEISKIQWYNIRDLPGFAKHNKGGQQDVPSQNKFYMVAPFLGPLKKWISLQRQQNAIADAQLPAPGSPVTHAHLKNADEDIEVVKEEQVVPDPAPVDQIAELKRLLSIGSVPEPSPQPQLPAANGGQKYLGNAPTKPTAGIPQTPLDQINAFPPQPQTPQPHHSRHPPLGYQQPVPQFLFSPQRLQQEYAQQQQRSFSVPDPGVFGPAGLPPQFIQQHQQQQQQQQQHQRASMPAPHIPTPFQQQQTGSQNRFPFAIPQQQPVQPPTSQTAPQIPQRQPQMPSYFPRPSDAFMAPQGPLGVIGGGPAVPKAEALPLPKLNAHSLNLLNAFRADGSKPAGSNSGAGGQQASEERQTSQHQDALLSLFRKPSQFDAELAKEDDQVPTSPALTDTTVKPYRPAASQQRKATLNEITRTLPMNFKVKSPTASKPPTQPPATQRLAMNARVHTDRPKSRGQLYDPASGAMQSLSVLHRAKITPTIELPEQTTVPILQRPLPQQQHGTRSPKSQRSPRAKGTENGQPHTQQPPAFTILPRPSSVRAARSPPAELRMPSSPLRDQTPVPEPDEKSLPAGFQPQVLKRQPETVDPEMVQKVAEVVQEIASPPGAGGQDKRVQLLALFGKTGLSSPEPTPALMPVPAPAPAGRDGGAEERKNSLLNLFTGSGVTPPYMTTKAASTAPNPASATPTSTTPTALLPPPAPMIVPERKPGSQSLQALHQRQKTPPHALLDLFKRPTAAKLDSPSTPISPFTLGTPVQRHTTQPIGVSAHAPSHLAKEIRHSSTSPTPIGASNPPTPLALDGQSRSRGLGSVVSAEGGSGGDESRKGSGAGTPVETKGFLLDYLRHVVSAEGQRGARRG